MDGVHGRFWGFVCVHSPPCGHWGRARRAFTEVTNRNAHDRSVEMAGNVQSKVEGEAVLKWAESGMGPAHARAQKPRRTKKEKPALGPEEQAILSAKDMCKQPCA